MQPRNRRLSTHLHDLHLANHRIPIEALNEPQHSVRDGEDRILFSLRGLVLADEKRRRFPAGEPDRQLLHEVLQIEVAVLCPFGSLGHRSKGIDNHHAGVRRFDFPNDAFQELLQRAVDHVLAQIDVADRLIHAGDIEEGELLLIAQHLEGGLADDGEVQRGTIGTGEGEHDLLRERRFPRAWSAGNEIEGELRQPPPPRIWSSPGTPVGSRRIATRSVMPYVSSMLASEKASGHAFRNRRVVKGSPMKVTSNPVNVVSTAPAASVATAGSCRSRQKTI